MEQVLVKLATENGAVVLICSIVIYFLYNLYKEEKAKREAMEIDYRNSLLRQIEMSKDESGMSKQLSEAINELITTFLANQVKDRLEGDKHHD